MFFLPWEYLKANMSEHAVSLTPVQTFYFLLIAILCLTISGTCAGLNISLFSIDYPRLKIMAQSRSRAKKAKNNRGRARRIMGLLDKANLVLTTILLVDVLCMLIFPVCLHRVMGVTALPVAVLGMLVGGEIIPTSIFVRYSMAICAFLSPGIWLFVYLFIPITYPIAKLQLLILGEDKRLTMNRQRLIEILESMETQADDVPLTKDVSSKSAQKGAIKTIPISTTSTAGAEFRLLRGILAAQSATLRRLATTTDGAAVYPLTHKLMLSSDCVVTNDKNDFASFLQQIMGYQGVKPFKESEIEPEDRYERIPIYYKADKSHIIGCLLTKSLLSYCSAVESKQRGFAPQTVGQLFMSNILHFSLEMTLPACIHAFSKSDTKMAAVYDDNGVLFGFTSWFDVLRVLYQLSAGTRPNSPMLDAAAPSALLGMSRKASRNSLASLGRPTSSSRRQSQHVRRMSVHNEGRVERKSLASRENQILLTYAYAKEIMDAENAEEAYMD